METLQGKIAVVLGASAKAGTGWAIAEKLAAAGAKVVVGARSIAPLEELAAKIGGTAVRCDAADPAQVKRLADAALETYGALHIAVNSAGLPMLSMIADVEEAQLLDAARVNYFGQVFFVKEMARAMQSNGSIVLISSLSSTHPVMPHFAYACAKAATDCLVRYAALEYGPRGIRVNSILPGPIVSDLAGDLFKDARVVTAFEKEIALGRLGYPADFADAVLWLAGPAYISGHSLPICGGLQLARFPKPHELPGGERAFDGNDKPLFDRQPADR